MAVIEDDKHLRDLLADCLADEGYAVTTYPSYEAALPSLRDGGAEVVVTDCIDCDYAALTDRDRERIRAVAANAPTILCTARAWAPRADPRDLGLVAILTKPLDLDRLVALVQQAAER